MNEYPSFDEMLIVMGLLLSCLAIWLVFAISAGAVLVRFLG